MQAWGQLLLKVIYYNYNYFVLALLQLQLQLLLKITIPITITITFEINILQLLITFLAKVNVTLCQNVITYLLFSMSMFYNSCLILLNVCIIC